TAFADTYTLSLHDALPILPWKACSPWGLQEVCGSRRAGGSPVQPISRAVYSAFCSRASRRARPSAGVMSPCSTSRTLLEIGSSRSEEHTSELQSRENLVCR